MKLPENFPVKPVLIALIAAIFIIGAGFAVLGNSETQAPQVTQPAQEQGLDESQMMNNLENGSDEQNAALNDNSDTSDLEQENQGTVQLTKALKSKFKKTPAPKALPLNIPVNTPAQPPIIPPTPPVTPPTDPQIPSGEQTEEPADPLDPIDNGQNPDEEGADPDDPANPDEPTDDTIVSDDEGEDFDPLDPLNDSENPDDEGEDPLDGEEEPINP